MYRVNRNDFYKNEKKSTIYTPDSASQYLFSLVKDCIPKGLILDPCVGKGSLLLPFMKEGYEVLGIDIDYHDYGGSFLHKNYLDIEKGEVETPKLVIMNPPFNIDAKTKEYVKNKYSGRPLLPEVWLMKTLELFGKDIPIVLIAPYGLRLNLTETSKRWLKFINGEYPEIASIVSLPKNLFNNVLFHCEVLIFNITGLKSHYFYGMY